MNKTLIIDNQPYRHIELQGLRANITSSYPNNSITSTKYTRFNFVPKNLLHQFNNSSKLWFLLISILELTNQSETTYKFGTVCPLITLILLQMSRDGLYDYFRFLSDQKENDKNLLSVRRNKV
jgi:hypothetical protein